MLIPRPADITAPEWDGEAFPPPIKSALECTFAVENHDTWHKGKVCFHGVDPEGREYFIVDTSAYQACFRSTERVRRVRTKEQRERDEVVDLALALDEYPRGKASGGLLSRHDFCEKLYNAGILRRAEK